MVVLGTWSSCIDLTGVDGMADGAAMGSCGSCGSCALHWQCDGARLGLSCSRGYEPNNVVCLDAISMHLARFLQGKTKS